MYRALKIGTIVWAWGCWAWVIYSRQWIWLLFSLIPYFLFTSLGHRLNKNSE